MKNNLIVLFFMFCVSLTFAQADKVTVENSTDGSRLLVNGESFMINGMNWDYIPIGTDVVDASFWTKSDDVIKAGLDTEMSLLKNMGVNVIRQ